MCVWCPGPYGSGSPVCWLGVLCCVCGVLGHLAPVHRCARLARRFACAVSWATWLLLTSVPARRVVLGVRGPGPLCSCSPVCLLGVLFCLSGVLRHWAAVHRCAYSACCVACVVSWATWLLFTGVPARCAVLGVRCPWPLGSCSLVCPPDALVCVCGVLGHLALVQRCAHSVCCLRVRCPGPLGSCSPVCPLGAFFCLCGVLGHLAPVHQCARLVFCFACVVSRATWLLFTGVPAWCIVLPVRRPGPLGSRSPVFPLGVLCCVCVFQGHSAPVHRSACLVRRFACAVSWASGLLFTGVPARRVVLCVRCPGPLDSRWAVCPLGVLCCVCGVLGHLALVHRCARSVCCVACAVSCATLLLFTGVPARCVALRVRCPGTLGSCLPVCPLRVLLACAASWATWLLFTGVPTWCVVLLVRCPWPLGSCSPVCPLGASFCLCGVLGHLASAQQCARSACFVGCAVSWATWLLFTGVPARRVVLCVRCPGPHGSGSPVCLLSVLFCLCSVLGHLAPVHRCASLVRCFACAVSWATWLLFTGVPAWCVVLLVRCPGPLCSC